MWASAEQAQVDPSLPKVTQPPPLLAAPRQPPQRRSTPSIQTDLAGQPANIEEHADKLVIRGTAQQAQVECKGRLAEVVGNYLVVQLSDTCSKILVRGDANVVTVGTVAGIDIEGNDNAVTWKAFPGDDTGRKSPFVRDAGQHNQVVAGN